MSARLNSRANMFRVETVSAIGTERSLFQNNIGSREYSRLPVISDSRFHFWISVECTKADGALPVQSGRSGAELV